MTQKIEPPAVAGSPEWWSSRPQRTERSRGPGRPSMPFDRIIATAVETVDAVGPEAFNMRLLAERLESGTATLYRHFTSKDEILAYVVDRILGELQVDERAATKSTWQQACMAVSRELFRVLSAHPHIVPLMVSRVPVGPNSLRNRERSLAVLLANGFSPELAARAYATLAHYVLGFAVQRQTGGAIGIEDSADLLRFFDRLDAQVFPATHKVARYLSGISLDEEFQFGLELIIDGLDRARRSRAASTRR